jgi:hypothetical protein
MNKALARKKIKITMHTNKSRGFGDSVEKFTTKTGIKKVVEKVTKAAGVEDCGCAKRRDTLNRIIPYKK